MSTPDRIEPSCVREICWLRALATLGLLGRVVLGVGVTSLMISSPASGLPITRSLQVEAVFSPTETRTITGFVTVDEETGELSGELGFSVPQPPITHDPKWYLAKRLAWIATRSPPVAIDSGTFESDLGVAGVATGDFQFVGNAVTVNADFSAVLGTALPALVSPTVILSNDRLEGAGPGAADLFGNTVVDGIEIGTFDVHYRFVDPTLALTTTTLFEASTTFETTFLSATEALDTFEGTLARTTIPEPGSLALVTGCLMLLAIPGAPWRARRTGRSSGHPPGDRHCRAASRAHHAPAVPS